MSDTDLQRVTTSVSYIGQAENISSWPGKTLLFEVSPSNKRGHWNPTPSSDLKQIRCTADFSSANARRASMSQAHLITTTTQEDHYGIRTERRKSIVRHRGRVTTSQPDDVANRLRQEAVRPESGSTRKRSGPPTPATLRSGGLEAWPRRYNCSDRASSHSLFPCHPQTHSPFRCCFRSMGTASWSLHTPCSKACRCSATEEHRRTG